MTITWLKHIFIKYKIKRFAQISEVDAFITVRKINVFAFKVLVC